MKLFYGKISQRYSAPFLSKLFEKRQDVHYRNKRSEGLNSQARLSSHDHYSVRTGRLLSSCDHERTTSETNTESGIIIPKEKYDYDLNSQEDHVIEVTNNSIVKSTNDFIVMFDDTLGVKHSSPTKIDATLVEKTLQQQGHDVKQRMNSNSTHLSFKQVSPKVSAFADSGKGESNSDEQFFASSESSSSNEVQVGLRIKDARRRSLASLKKLSLASPKASNGSAVESVRSMRVARRSGMVSKL